MVFNAHALLFESSMTGGSCIRTMHLQWRRSKHRTNRFALALAFLGLHRQARTMLTVLFIRSDQCWGSKTEGKLLWRAVFAMIAFLSARSFAAASNFGSEEVCDITRRLRAGSRKISRSCAAARGNHTSASRQRSRSLSSEVRPRNVRTKLTANSRISRCGTARTAPLGPVFEPRTAPYGSRRLG